MTFAENPRAMLLRILLLVLLVGLAGCAVGSLEVKNEQAFSKAPGLYQSFRDYWSARASLDDAKAFSMEIPYNQLLYDKAKYRSFIRWFGKARLDRLVVKRVVCEKPFYCCVGMKMEYTARGGKKEERSGYDCWVKVGGKWWHIMKNPILGPVI